MIFIFISQIDVILFVSSNNIVFDDIKLLEFFKLLLSFIYEQRGPVLVLVSGKVGM